MSAPRLEAPETLLKEAIGPAGIPAAAACVLHQGTPIHQSAHGESEQGLTANASLFDIASITKVLATTTSAAVLVARSELDLDRPVCEMLDSCELPATITPRSLLAHTSGLEAWRPLFELVRADPVTSVLYGSEPADPGIWARARQMVQDSARRPRPLLQAGSCVYSDLGFIVLGEVIESTSSASLDAVASELVLGPLGLKDTYYVRLPIAEAADLQARRHVLPTGRRRPRPPAPGQESLFEPGPANADRVAEVDDDNAWAMGGVAAHAGLFSTARDVASWGHLLLEEIQGANRLGAGEVLRDWMRPTPTGRGLGFDCAQGQGSTAGGRWGQAGTLGGVGHLGFTGCSVWIDMDRELSAALLTNRVFPGREHVEPIGRLRPAFHEAILDSLAR